MIGEIIIIIMFSNNSLSNIKIRVIMEDRVEQTFINVDMNQVGQVNLNELALYLRKKYKVSSKFSLMYFDHSRFDFMMINSDILSEIHFTCLICEDVITFKFELKPQKQVINGRDTESSRKIRSRQRKIYEAFMLVQKWRFYYNNGIQQKSHKINVSLDQSAQLVGVPRKTLEDYYLLFRLAKARQFNFIQNRQQKMGTLRSYVRLNKEKNEVQKEQDQRQSFMQLHYQIIGQKSQEQIFDILKSNLSFSQSEGALVLEN